MLSRKEEIRERGRFQLPSSSRAYIDRSLPRFLHSAHSKPCCVLTELK